MVNLGQWAHKIVFFFRGLRTNYHNTDYHDSFMKH